MAGSRWLFAVLTLSPVVRIQIYEVCALNHCFTDKEMGPTRSASIQVELDLGICVHSSEVDVPLLLDM